MSSSADIVGNASTDQKKFDVYADVAPEIKIRTKKMMMWFIIFAIVMLFAGVTSALIVLYGKLLWVYITPPAMLWVSLALIVASSITYMLSIRNVKAGKVKASVISLSITLALGLAFVFTQNAGWQQLSSSGMGYTVTENEQGVKSYRWNTLGRIKSEYGKDYVIEFHGEPLVKEGNEFYMASDTGRLNPRTTEVMTTFNASGALLSVLIYVHIIHLFFGLIYLVVNLVRTSKGRINASNWISLHTGGMYWHFMGLLWAYLFFFLFFIY